MNKIEKIEDNKADKIHIVNHRDMDGAGCEIVLRNVYPDATITSTQCTYKDAREIVNKRLERNYRFDLLYICDILFDEVDSYFIREKLQDGDVFYIDHHAGSVEKLSGPEYNSVVSNDMSATKLLYENFKDDADLSHIKQLVNIIDDYDMWREEMHDVSFYLNTLYFNYWNDKFVRRFLDGKINFRENERKVIKKHEHSFNTELANLNPVDVFGDGKVFVDELDGHVNRIADKYLRGYGAEVAVMIRPENESISVRAEKENDIDLSVIMEEVGGGGHKKAGGCEYTEENLNNLLEILQSELNG